MDDLDLDASWKRRLRRNVTAWYDDQKRDLPWRRTCDPYAIWISEIMLQQTTVTAVVPYFNRFLATFPTVQELSRAPEEQVLRLWEGLGYYSRARNIHRTAKQIVEEHAGNFPAEVAALQKLPGIGRYTAGAIASFAFDRPAPIVEANTLRLYCRLMGYRGDPRSREGQKRLWKFAEAILPRTGARRLNQAVMELGSVVCTPAGPRCGKCPVKMCCQAFAEGAQAEIPLPMARPEVTPITEGSIAVRGDDGFLLYRRPYGERWAGLWDFPRFPLETAPATQLANCRKGGTIPQGVLMEVESGLYKRFGVRADVRALVAEIRHSVTRYRIRLLCFDADCRPRQNVHEGIEFRWVRPEEFGSYPFSVTGRKLARLLVEA